MLASNIKAHRFERFSARFAPLNSTSNILYRSPRIALEYGVALFGGDVEFVALRAMRYARPNATDFAAVHFRADVDSLALFNVDVVLSTAVQRYGH